MLRVLLTGYAAFDRKSDNPSGDIAKALNGTCTQHFCIESLVLSVDTHGASVVSKLLSATNSSKWDAILHMGEDIPAMFTHTTHAHIELAAYNVKSHTSLLHRANTSTSSWPSNKLIKEAQDILPATADASSLAAVAALPSVIWHRDAGEYYCNEVFFRTTYAVRHGRIRPPSRGGGEGSAATTALLPSLFMHVPPPDVLPVATGQQVAMALLSAMVASSPPLGSLDVNNKPRDTHAGLLARTNMATDEPLDRAATQPRVLLGGFGDRLGPDRGGAAVVALNATCEPSPGVCYDGLIMERASDAGAVAAALHKAGAALPWQAVLLVAEQHDRFFDKMMAVQVVAYTRGGPQGDESDIVLPSTANLGKLNPNPDRPRAHTPPAQDGLTWSVDDAALTWSRQNADFGFTGEAYYQTLVALGNVTLTTHEPPPPTLLTALPYADKRSVADDAKLVAQLVEQMMA